VSRTNGNMHPIEFMKNLFIPAFIICVLSSCLKQTDEIKNDAPHVPVAGFSFYGNETDTPAVVTFYNSSTYADGGIWRFGDSTTSTEKNPVHTFRTPGNHSVTLVATGFGLSDSITKIVAVNPPPIADFEFTGNGSHAPAWIVFTNKSRYATKYKYFWDFGDSTYSNLDNPIHTYKHPGIHTITLEATRDDLTNTVSKAITIAPEYTTATLTKLDLTRAPFQRPNGTDWDNLPMWPDIYLVLEDSAGAQLYKSPITPNANFMATYTVSLVFTKAMWAKTYRIRVMDDDGATSEEMDQGTFRIDNYGAGTYPTLIDINKQNLHIALSFTWQ